MSRRVAARIRLAPPNIGLHPRNPMPIVSEIASGLAGRAEAHLRRFILPFWLEHSIDRERGGFVGHLRDDMTTDPGAPRGSLLASRILWTFSAAHRAIRDPDPRWLEMARYACSDLLGRFLDREHGGLLWSLDANGRPLASRKQVYGQAFGIYALSEYHRATGDPAALEHAIELFRLVERHARDRRHGGYVEALDREWKPVTDWRLSEIDLNSPKSQNTLLHVMEAYTNLLRVWPDPELRGALEALVEAMLAHVLDPVGHHLWLFFDEKWAPLSDRISYGHDIEASWLLTVAAEVVGDASLAKRVRDVALRMADVTRTEALDDDGGLLYEGGPGGVTVTDKEWWPQAEAVVGFVNAWQISGERGWIDDACRCWGFIEDRLTDRVNGEWYRAVTRDGRRFENDVKAGFWKCPYHNGRACIELGARLAGAR
jgi:mannobiose 2-epimerase